MKKRTAFICAILSLLPLGHTFLIKTGIVLSSSALIIALPAKVFANTCEKYFSEGYIKSKNDDHKGAIFFYSKAINSGCDNTNLATAYYNRGFSKNELRNFFEAISDFNEAIEINPQYSKAYLNRGYSKHHLGDYYGAISDFNKAIEINPNNGLTYSNRGISKGIGFKDDEGACDDFKKAAFLGDKYRIMWLESFEGKWCKDM